MRRWTLEKYTDGNKHRFKGTIERFGSYTDRESGKIIKTVLLTSIEDENDRPCTDHAWVKDKCIDKYGLKKGERYSFMARVGTYKRGRTARDYQLKNLTQFTAA